MSLNKSINSTLSTLNFVLFFVGYQLVTTIFLPSAIEEDTESQAITIPYRAITLLLSFSVIILNIKVHVSFPLAIKLFIFYWLLLFFRIYYDFHIRLDVFVLQNEITRTWLYVIMSIISSFSVWISYRSIDLDKSLQYVYIGFCVICFISFITNPSLSLSAAAEIKSRIDGNIALNTISFGHLGGVTVLLSFYMLIKRQASVFIKVVIAVFLCIGFFIMLRAASKGPLLTLFLIVVVWAFSNSKNILKGFSIISFIILLICVFYEQLIELIKYTAPVMADRILFMQNTGDLGRELLYSNAILAFIDNPLSGSSFAFFSSIGKITYSHNILLDSFMGMGLIGGLLMCSILYLAFKYSYHSIKNNDSHFWIELVLLQQILSCMTSGSFYFEILLNILLICVFVRNKIVLLSQ